MAFPITPRATRFEAYLNGDWVNITNDVYARDAVVITRGRSDFAATAEPSECAATLNNRSGNYSPRNPVGAYYGSVGRNTPLRCGVELLADTFTRTVSSGWGAADTGQAYTLTGSGGTVAAANLNVASGVGTVSVPVANAIRTVTPAGFDIRNIDVSFAFSLPLASITGAAVVAIVTIRDNGGTDYVYTAVRINTDSTIRLQIVDNFDVSFIADVPTSVIYVASQKLRVRVQADGDTFRAKVWLATSPEPYNWQAVGQNEFYSAPGSVSLGAWVTTGNTNTLPVVFTFDDLSIRSPRFSGELSSLPQRWDTSGIDVYVPMAAAGLSRRLRQGAPLLSSALFQALTTLTTPPVVYWPCEDGKNSPYVASGIGGSPMTVEGSTDFASYTNLPSSAPLPTLKTSTWTGRVPTYTNTNSTQLRFFCEFAGTAPVFTPIVEMFTTGSIGYYAVVLTFVAPDPPQLGLWVFDTKGGTQYLNLANSSLLASEPQFITLELTQSGSNILYQMNALPVGVFIVETGQHTLTTGTIGTVTKIVVDPNRALSGATIGHVNLRKEITPINDIATQTNAYLGENAVDRLVRLCGLTGVPFVYRGHAGFAETMGYQNVTSLLDQFDDCEVADMGLQYEPRGFSAMGYRSRRSLYSQNPTLTLDYTAKQIAPELTPTDDDDRIMNDITVTRQDATSVHDELVTGPLSVNPPEQGGVGRYAVTYITNIATDDRLPDIAGWLLNIGTADESRYPQVHVNLAISSVVTAGLEQAAMDVDIGDKIAIINPKTGQTPDTIRLIVLGYTETFNVFKHDIVYNCVPESPYEIAQFDAAPNAYYIAGAAATLTSGYSTTATTMIVNTGVTPWKTGAVSIPVTMAGELMTVTNITGAASPQTFTVTRSVNSVVKTQSINTVVTIPRYYRAVIGL